ncbi:tetratricopeptide repeat protein [Paraburkholderia sp. BR10872]|uniref:tetratricopeptide repeat protein n=1 Tax=Paraburkholderia sp. BR10872 TaxID=3236989 RepID=UPI0034D2E596
MSHFDELPHRHRNHEIEDNAIAAFQMRLGESGAFILQAADRKDYGTDCQIEVIADGRATNARVHVQLKGTEGALNANGSLSVGVDRTNLNYLLMQPYSFYVAYHVPTRSLRIRTVESVVQQYEHGGTNWSDQASLTVSFVDELTPTRLDRIAELARAWARASRDRRIGAVGVSATDLSSHVLASAPDVHVPDDPARARNLLVQLYEQNADDAISAGFASFAAALGAGSDAMGICYMAEINLGMDDLSHHPERIEEAIRFFRARLTDRRHQVSDLQYTIGNAFHALQDEPEAKRAFEAALADPMLAAAPELAAQIHKNLGSSYALLGDHDPAMDHYHEALRLNPELAEAHTALGIHYVRVGRYEDALHHLDQVVFSNQKQGRTFTVTGWRANVLFNLGDGRAAFREINGLVAQADRFRWIWPWCRGLVAAFGRSSVDNARQALPFWQRYVRANPEDPQARYELLMTTFYLRGKGENVGKTYGEFCEEFDRHIAQIDADNAALPWDRLGHWAQEDDDWAEAERCFRQAYELAGGEYGFCLAIALKELGRFAESVPLLLEQAQTVQPDAMSWFQLAASYASLGCWPEAIDGYERTLGLDPDHDLARFDLGGAHWNGGDPAMAAEVWASAIARFPEHDLSAKLMHDFPSLFGDPAAGQTGDGAG